MSCIYQIGQSIIVEKKNIKEKPSKLGQEQHIMLHLHLTSTSLKWELEKQTILNSYIYIY